MGCKRFWSLSTSIILLIFNIYDIIIYMAEEKKLRQIIIETDGNDIKLTKAEVSGKIELIAILEFLINYLRINKNTQNAKVNTREDK
jgi:hypothetical protein